MLSLLYTEALGRVLGSSWVYDSLHNLLLHFWKEEIVTYVCVHACRCACTMCMCIGSHILKFNSQNTFVPMTECVLLAK